MKAVVVAAALMSAVALVQAGEMSSKDKAASHGASHGAAHAGTHKAVGVVKKLDSKAGTATIAHEQVKTLNWPAMTMPFKVQDKALMGKLGEGKKVEFEFEQRGKDSVITSVK
jgi:Cu(I)/Ag(I) efflux system protein CusF